MQWASPGNAIGAKYYSYAQNSGSAPVTTWYDVLGREVRQDTYGLNNKKIYVSTEYYTSGSNKGRLYRVSEPYFEGDSKTWAETYNTYDQYGRLTLVTTPMGQDTTVYDGLSTTIKTPEGSKTTTLNSAGLIASNTVNGKTVSYTYYPSGLTKTATPQGGQSLSMEYNLQGKRTKLTDPDAGVIETKYNGFGELVEEKQKIHDTANWITTTNNYAPTTGLLQSISRNGETTSYTYDTASGYPGRILSINIPGQHKQSFSYDELSRVINVKEEIGVNIFNQSTEYDALGRVKKEIYPSGYYTNNYYDPYGYLIEIKDKSNKSIWKFIEENAKGQTLEIQKGGKTSTFVYNNKGMPTSMQASGIVNLTYGFEDKGNLSFRQDNLTNQKEMFVYDGMNRLTNWDIYQNNSLVKQNSLTYNSTTGNIQTKSDIGNYTMNYGEGNGKPHALTSISGVPTNFPTNDLIVTYTDFKKIKTLTEGSKNYTITYGIDDQRRKSVYKENTILKETRYYLGNYEEKTDHTTGITEKIHYLSGAIYIERSNGTKLLYYAYTDYLGSLIALTNEAGTVVERYAYNPWGERRNPTNWTQTDTRTSWLINRGYTMHEHLSPFGGVGGGCIINMNGRVYDPLTASFFSPDPYIQAPGNWLNYNRYAYAYGNPFKYTDPDGEFIFTVLSAIFCPALLPMAVQMDIGWITGGIGAVSNGDSFWKGALPGLAIGTVNGALSMISPVKIPFGNSGFGLNIAPQIALGTDGLGIGFNASLGYNLGKGFDIGVNFGGTYYASATGTNASGFEGRLGYGINYKSKYFQAGIGSTYFFSGETSQLNGQMYAGGGNWKVTYENDTWAPVPGLWQAGGPESDRFRTAAVRFDMTGGKLKGLNAGLNIFTGEASGKRTNGVFDGPGANKYRLAVIYAGYYNARIGYNSEKNIRGPIQNGFHNMFNYPHFGVLNIPSRLYFGFYSSNPYTLW